MGKKILNSFSINTGFWIFVKMKNFNRIASFLFLITCSFSDAFAQGNSLLWEISGKGSTDTSYLFGTIHIRDKRVFNLGDSTYYAINKTRALFGELNIQNKSEIKKYASDIMMPAGTSLKTLLSASDYKVVKKYCKKHLGVYAILINKVKPIFISAVISSNLLKKDEKNELDTYLQEYAAKQGKTIGGLETVKEQMAVLNKLSLQEQANILLDQITNIEEEKVMMEHMLQIYLSESLDSLDVLVQSDSSSSEEFDEAILNERNKIMVERMETQIRNQPTFFAVGAAHLAGDKGLIMLLRKKGYNVRPVKRK